MIALFLRYGITQAAEWLIVIHTKYKRETMIVLKVRRIQGYMYLCRLKVNMRMYLQDLIAD